MTPPNPQVNQTYIEYAQLLLELHTLLLAGKDDTSTTERVEDRMTAIWERLDGAQRTSLNGIAADLAWVRRRGEPPPRGRSFEQVTEKDMAAIDEVPGGSDYHARLYHLRVGSPRLSLERLAYDRAAYYHKLGFSGLSVVFADFGVQVARTNDTIARRSFEALMRLDPARAFHRAVAVTESPEDYSPIVVVLAIGYTIDTLGGPAAIDGSKVISAVREARKRVEAASLLPGDLAAFYQIAGAELLAYGADDEGRETYELGLRLDPNNPAILAGLGMAIYESDKGRAVDLFQKAIMAGAKFTRPYIHMAHYHLVRREFGLAFGYAKQGLELAHEAAARGAILEMMAISASEVGVDGAQVLKMFREAARLSHNSRIAANLKAFEDSMAGRSAKAVWDYREDPATLRVTETNVQVGSRAVEFAGA